MKYEEFAKLLKLKFSFLRALHQQPPRGHAIIRRNIVEIDLRLAQCTPEEYSAHMKRYSVDVALVG